MSSVATISSPLRPECSSKTLFFFKSFTADSKKKDPAPNKSDLSQGPFS